MDALNPVAPWQPFASPRWAGWSAGVILLLTVAVFLLQAVPETAAWVATVDAAWHARMVQAQTPFWLGVASLLQVAGSAWIMVPLRLAVAVLLWTRRLRERFLFWMLASVSTEVLALILKAVYGKARPPDGLSHTVNTAFPSGHTSTATSIAFGLVLVFVAPGRARRIAVPLALLWSLGMAWSRTYLRDHWLSDTAAGFLLGLSCVLLAAVFVGGRRGRTRPPSSPSA